MRVTQQMLFNSQIKYIQAAADAVWDANEISSSGKRINRASDDPSGQATVMTLRSQLSALAQQEENLDMAESWLDSAENALSQIESILSEISSLAVQMANTTQTADERTQAAEQVEIYLEEIVSLANTEVAGRYIFGGNQTSQAPFSLDGDGNVTYVGSQQAFEIISGPTSRITVGQVGEDIFGSGSNSLFTALNDLIDGLEDNDVSAISAALSPLEDQLDAILSAEASIGAKQNGIEIRRNMIEELELMYTERKSNIEDADMTEAVIELESAELIYQAALKASTEVMALSVLNYL